MRRAVAISGILVLGAVLCGCGGGDDPDGSVAMDGALDSGAGPVMCARNADCDDGVFCNGEETCAPGDDADERGCLAGDNPCEGMVCDDVDDVCDTNCDQDGDGEDSIECGGADCDDSNGAVNSTAAEVCDTAGLDEDCDPSTLAGPEGDADNDDFIDARCFNLLAGGAGENRGTDCDDARPTINIDGVEACDGRDNDCDGMTDEGVLETYYRDVDGDNFGDAAMSMMDCTAPTGWVLNATDCDDRAGAINPSADEVCDGSTDENCDTFVDEGCACSDGMTQPCGPPEPLFGRCVRSTVTCTDGAWPTSCPGAVFPRLNGEGAGFDPCGNGDEDCDGVEDEDGQVAFYLDSDSDGFGDPDEQIMACPGDEGSSYVRNSDDCDDGDSAIKPGAIEVCDGVDNNCSSVVDDRAGGCSCIDGATRSCGTDVGECETGIETCGPDGTFGACVGATSPGLESDEDCDGLDQDCDGRVDETAGGSAPRDAARWFRDSDGDTWGSEVVDTYACVQPSGYVARTGDCRDDIADVNPGHTSFEDTAACPSGGGSCTFDYDCQNGEELRGTGGCSGSFFGGMFSCSLTYGPARFESLGPADCGEFVQYAVGCSANVIPCENQEEYGSRRLECR